MDNSHDRRRLATAPDAPATAATTRGHAAITTVGSSLTLALVYERLAITLYYTALTTPAVMRDRRLAGRSAHPHHRPRRSGQQPDPRSCALRDALRRRQGAASVPHGQGRGGRGHTGRRVADGGADRARDRHARHTYRHELRVKGRESNERTG